MSFAADLPDCSQQFQTDYNKLTADAQQYETDKQNAKTAMADAVNSAINIDVQEYQGHPDELLIVLLMTVLGGQLDNAYQYQLAVTGDKVQLQSDMSALINDIQAAPNAAASTGDAVENVAAETDVMQDLLSNTSDATATALQSALGSQASSFMCTNFANMRHDIYWAQDPEAANTNANGAYNPALNPTTPANTSTFPYTYHFVVSDTPVTGYMTNYAELQQNLQQQNDQYGAQAASTTLVNNYNQNVSSVQSLGTAVNSEIGMITSKIKANTNAESAFAQDILTLARTSVRNQVTQ